ncbi:hypothetical protein SL1157_0681 [Ruegeria lacuscaerulensis ITI-1157]|nr:hypothetical protein SL1157_0681 [Ruegeria lacuscaerulensis ITI-1157]
MMSSRRQSASGVRPCQRWRCVRGRVRTKTIGRVEHRSGKISQLAMV